MRKDFYQFIAPSLKEERRRNRDVSYVNYKLDPKYLNLGLTKKYFIKTYGCQGNLSDSEKIAGMLESMGFSLAKSESESDVLIFNTCAVRENAENRLYGEIGRSCIFKKENPDLLFCVCGCMPQEEATVQKLKAKYPQVDIVFGTHNLYLLPEYLKNAYENKKRVFSVLSIPGNIVEGIPKVRGGKVSAWVDIMYGCDEFCTYCIVPYTRGKQRSRLPEAVINEVVSLKKEGYKEVTLLGQNVNAYGKDFLNRDYTFGDLLADVSKTGIERIRFTTSHPRDLDAKTMLAMSKYQNIMPHLHLPVQSGSNAVLKRMNRKYTKELYLEKVKRLRSLIPGISLTTDIIVGFPGETDADFQETLAFVQEVGFEGAYTFVYSKRKGTPAADFPDQVDKKTAKARLLALNEVVNAGFYQGNLRFAHQTVPVLVAGVSGKDESMLTGYTPHNKLVNFVGNKALIGKIIPVKITKAFTWHLRGEVAKDF